MRVIAGHREPEPCASGSALQDFAEPPRDMRRPGLGERDGADMLTIVQLWRVGWGLALYGEPRNFNNGGTPRTEPFAAPLHKPRVRTPPFSMSTKLISISIPSSVRCGPDAASRSLSRPRDRIESVISPEPRAPTDGPSSTPIASQRSPMSTCDCSKSPSDIMAGASNVCKSFSTTTGSIAAGSHEHG